MTGGQYLRYLRPSDLIWIKILHVILGYISGLVYLDLGGLIDWI